MSGHGEKKSRKDDEAIAALLSSPTLAKAAAKVHVGEATLRRWLSEPEFQARYREARQHAVQHSIGALQRASSAAVETLERNLTCGKESVEVQAARTIIEQGVKAAELDDLMTRLDELERTVAGNEKGKGNGQG